MEWAEFSWLLFLIPIVAIVGGITSGIVATLSRARIRELEIRERIAMIERGLVPPPEVDPQGFDRAMNRYDRDRDWDADHRWPRRSPARFRSAGVTLMGVGVGLMLLIGFTGDAPQTAIGVGGFVLVLGLAFLLNSFITTRDDRPTMSPPPANRPSSQPPTFGGEPPRP